MVFEKLIVWDTLIAININAITLQYKYNMIAIVKGGMIAKSLRLLKNKTMAHPEHVPMSSYTENALSALKKRGYRITKPRKLVVQLLNDANTALSAYEIRDLLAASDEAVDIVSIYRILECLEENHLIHRVLLTGKVRKCQLDDEDHCQLPQDDHCHHLLICRQCNTTQEVHCHGMDAILAQVSQQARFQVEDHRLEFVGLCQACAAS